MYVKYGTQAPPCDLCGTCLHRIGQTPNGFQNYRCKKCRQYASAFKAIRFERNRVKELQATARRAMRETKTLAGFLQILAPEFQADGLSLDHYVRMTEAARQLGITRQRVHQKVLKRQMDVMKVKGVTWVRVT